MTMVALPASPLAPGRAPVEVFVRDEGSGPPILMLHGGWGYGVYPHGAQLAELTPDYRCLIPDRTGYGRSGRIAALPARFHEAAAIESEALLDALGIDRCALWGHSDGAVIAAIMGIRQPGRYAAIILEALHLDRVKPRSREFFTRMAENPDGFGARLGAALAADHGEADWRGILRAGGRAWLDIAATPDDDFYDRRLAELRAPVLVLHGADDPRTEPGELDRVRREVPMATVHMVAGGGHCPHAEREVAAEATAVAAAFLRRHHT